MVTGAVSPLAKGRAGFTLVELLLVTVLLLLMLGGVIFSFTSLQRNASLEEGASQVEALFRYARAQASSSGRPVRIAFEEDVGDGLEVPLGNLRVEWESDPLNAPGVYQELPDAASLVRSITDLVRVDFVRSVEPDLEMQDTNSVPGGVGSDSGTEGGQSVWITFPPVTFYPDGSSDSSELTLASRDDEVKRKIVLELSGLTGTVRRSTRLTGEDVPEPTVPEQTEPARETSAPAEKGVDSRLEKRDFDETTK